MEFVYHKKFRRWIPIRVVRPGQPPSQPPHPRPNPYKQMRI
jgi:hypothetical protein